MWAGESACVLSNLGRKVSSTTQRERTCLHATDRVQRLCLSRRMVICCL